MKKINNIIIFSLCFLVIYTGCGFVEINFNCTKCATAPSLYERIFPTLKSVKSQGKCTCGCNGGSCAKGGCSCGKKAVGKDLAKTNSDKPAKQTKESNDCVKHTLNKLDSRVETVSVSIPQILVIPAFFEYNPLSIFSLLTEENNIGELYYSGPAPPLLPRFILNLYCTLLI